MKLPMQNLSPTAAEMKMKLEHNYQLCILDEVSSLSTRILCNSGSCCSSVSYDSTPEALFSRRGWNFKTVLAVCDDMAMSSTIEHSFLLFPMSG